MMKIPSQYLLQALPVKCDASGLEDSEKYNAEADDLFIIIQQCYIRREVKFLFNGLPLLSDPTDFCGSVMYRD